MTKREAEAPFSYDGLDRVMHEKARLGVLSSLVAHPKGLAFSDLKQLVGLTDGNLARHLQVLQEAGLVDITKSHDGACGGIGSLSGVDRRGGELHVLAPG